MKKPILIRLILMLSLGLLGTLTSGSQRLILPDTLSGQTATLLPDGRWLLVGGEGSAGPLATAAIWASRTETTSPVPHTLEHSRAWHSATLLPDGNVLIVGGIGANGQVVSDVEIFDLVTQTFTVLPFTDLLPRAYHTATLLREGLVLITGGISDQGEVLREAELWDPATQTPARLPAGLRTARSSHSATLLSTGMVLIQGGLDQNDTVLRSNELYDPTRERFTFVVPATLPPQQAPDDSPHLEASLPGEGASEVPVDSRIVLHFSQPLRVETVNAATVTLSSPQGIAAATVIPAAGGLLVFITPQAPLLPNATYTLSLHGLTDTAGVSLPVTRLSFTTVRVSAEQHLDRSQTSPVRAPSPPVQEASGAQAAHAPTPDDEDWIFDARHQKGDWRTHLPDPPIRSRLPLQAAPGVTALSGQVLTITGKALEGVTLQIHDWKTQTDEHGQFLLVLPALRDSGAHVLLIDGRTAGKSNKNYGLFKARVAVLTGQTTILPFTIWLPKIDTAHAITIPSPTTGEVVVTTPRIPGLELHIPPGVVIRDHNGQVVTHISITAIPVDRPPFPLPNNVEVPIYFTIQPGGAYVVNAYGTGAQLFYPNYTDDLPGARANFWHYDPEEKGWYIYGLGTVTADGEQVIPDPGVTLYEFTGAMFNTGDTPPPNGPAPGNPNGSDGDPVDLSTGLFVLDKTDLILPDTLPVALTRTYRQGDNNSRPFGIGMTHLYAMFLWSARQYQEADLIGPDGGRIHYVRISPGTGFIDAVFEHTTTPSAFYKSRITWNGNGWDLRLKNGTVYVFGENAPLQSIRDRYGNKITLRRTNGQSGNITSITSPNGRWLEFSYDTRDRITQAKDNIGRVVTYTYDARGRLWKVREPHGGLTQYTYDTSNRMRTVQDARGIVFLTNVYEPTHGRVIKQTQADGSAYRFTYTTNANGQITQTRVTDPRGNVRGVTFNARGYTLTDTYAVGKPAQQTTVYKRATGTNLLLSVTDSLARKIVYTYDTLGNVTRITRLAGTPRAVTTSLAYEPIFNQVTKITDPLHHRTTFAYDAKGNLVSLTDPLGHTTTLAYNTAGQPVSLTDPLRHRFQLTYDFGDLAAVTDPLGNSTTRFTDSAGRLVVQTNPLGNRTQYVYDRVNRVRQVTDPLRGVTAFRYDPNGNLLSVQDAQHSVTSYTYDRMDRLTTRQDPLRRSERYRYDTGGNLTQFTDRKGQVTTFAYDALNRRTKTTYADGSTSTYRYDKGDRLTKVVDSLFGTITYRYDSLDRLISDTTAQGTVRYTYDKAGRRTSMTVAGQPTITYTYDHANRLTQITQGTSAITIGYDSADRRTSLTLPNDVVVTYAYDAALRVTRITYKHGTTVLGNLTYAYDPAGHRIRTGGSWARTALPQAIASATYNAANQQRTLGNKTMTYDRNGNLVALTTPSGTTTFTWNARNWLVRMTGPGVTARFQYDALGRREVKTVNGVRTEFLYDGMNPVQETSGAAVRANILSGLDVDEYFTRTDAAGTRVLLTDALGSTVALTNNAGTVQTQYTYEPFGRTTATGATTNSFQYTGRENDGTGLYYYRARYYSPSLQRFVSEDPVGFLGGDINLYAYVGGNPVNQTDPTGWWLTPDTILDIGFIAYDIYALATGGRKDFGTNLAALGADIRGLLLLGVTGVGMTVRAGPRVNKLGPLSDAPHTVFKRNPHTGRVTGYTEFDAAGNAVKRFRGDEGGRPHGGLEPPFILEPKPGKGPGAPPKVPRPPRPDELPRGYEP